MHTHKTVTEGRSVVADAKSNIPRRVFPHWYPRCSLDEPLARFVIVANIEPQYKSNDPSLLGTKRLYDREATLGTKVPQQFYLMTLGLLLYS